MLIPVEPLRPRVLLRLHIGALGITLLVLLATEVRFGGALAAFLLFFRGIVLRVTFHGAGASICRVVLIGVSVQEESPAAIFNKALEIVPDSL